MKKAITFLQPMRFTGTPNTSSWVGYDFLQWTGTTFHPGLDYNYGAGEQDKGLPVLCIGNGFVEKCLGWDGKTKGFGNHAFVKHILEDDTVIYSHYCHLDSFSCTEGKEINKGEEVGKCGGSGGWPSHLHLEVRPPINKGYDFWPKGYSKDWVAGNYFDPFGFIEKRKGEEQNPLQAELDKVRKERDDNHNLYKKEKAAKEGLETQVKDLNERLGSCKKGRGEFIKFLSNQLGPTCSADESAIKGKIEEILAVEDQKNTAEGKVMQLQGLVDKYVSDIDKLQDDLTTKTEQYVGMEKEFKACQTASGELEKRILEHIITIDKQKKKIELLEQQQPINNYSGFQLIEEIIRRIFKR